MARQQGIEIRAGLDPLGPYDFELLKKRRYDEKAYESKTQLDSAIILFLDNN
jgi:hypothetical protein